MSNTCICLPVVGDDFANVLQFGAKADLLTRTDALMAASSSTLTTASPAFSAGDVGKLFSLAGAGVGGAYLAGSITAYNSPTSVTVSVTSSAAVSGAALAYATDDTVAIQAAINSIPFGGGGTVYFPKGIYSCAALTVYNRPSIMLKGEQGAVLRQNSNNTLLAIGGGYGTVNAITAIDRTTIDLPNPTTIIYHSNVTRLTLASAPSPDIVVGAVLKIVNDEEVFGTVPGDPTYKRRRGEFQRVILVDAPNNYVYVSGYLFDSYALDKNPRCAIVQNYEATVENLTFTTDDAGDSLNWGNEYVKFRLMQRATVRNCTILKGWNWGFSFLGCSSYTVTGCDINNLKNTADSTNNTGYGYGVHDIASDRGLISNCHGRNLRHLYTTGAFAVVENSPALDYYGMSRNAKIIGCTAMGCTNAPFDVHEGAELIEFIGCTAIQEAVGATSCPGAFQARTRSVSFKDCVAIGGNVGFYVSETHANSTQQTLIQNCVAKYCANSAVLSETLVDGTSCREIQIIGGDFETIGDASVFSFRKSDVVVHGAKLRVKNPSSSPAPVRLNDGANVEMWGCDFDYTGSFSGTSSRPQGFQVATAGTVTLNARGLTVRNGALAYLVEGQNNTSFTGDLRNVQILGNAGYSGGDYDTAHLGTGSTCKVQRLANDKSTAVLTPLDINASGVVLATASNAESSFLAQINLVGTSQSYTLGALQNGDRPGQTMKIRVVDKAGSSGNSLVIQNGVSGNTLLNGGVNVTLTNNSSIELTWNGSTWAQ